MKLHSMLISKRSYLIFSPQKSSYQIIEINKLNSFRQITWFARSNVVKWDLPAIFNHCDLKYCISQDNFGRSSNSQFGIYFITSNEFMLRGTPGIRSITFPHALWKSGKIFTYFSHTSVESILLLKINGWRGQHLRDTPLRGLLSRLHSSLASRPFSLLHWFTCCLRSFFLQRRFRVQQM